jgi:hypothetical protein
MEKRKAAERRFSLTLWRFPASLSAGQFCRRLAYHLADKNWAIGYEILTAVVSKRAIGDLLEFKNKTAWVNRNGTVVSIASDDLCVGDEVVVFPGEMIPV